MHEAWFLKAASLSQSLLFRCLFRRRSSGHNNSGDCFGGARSCALLEMGCGNSLDAHLCTKRGDLVSELQVGKSVKKSKGNRQVEMVNSQH